MGYIPTFRDWQTNGWSTAVILQRVGFDINNLPNFPSSPPPVGYVWSVSPQGYAMVPDTAGDSYKKSAFFDYNINAYFTNGGNVGGPWRGRIDQPQPMSSGITVPSGQVGNTYWGQTPSNNRAGNMTLTLLNVSTGEVNPTNVHVGDIYQVKISGAAPNSTVTASSTQNSNSNGTNSFGNTDSYGNFVIGGTFTAASLGTWIETWYVGGSIVGSFGFNVLSAQTQSTQQQTSASGSGASQTNYTTTNANSQTSGSNQQYNTPTTTTQGQSNPQTTVPGFFTSTMDIGGMSIPVWALAAGTLALVMMMGKR